MRLHGAGITDSERAALLVDEAGARVVDCSNPGAGMMIGGAGLLLQRGGELTGAVAGQTARLWPALELDRSRIELGLW